MAISVMAHNEKLIIDRLISVRHKQLPIPSVLIMATIELPFSYGDHGKTQTSIVFTDVTFTKDVTLPESDKKILKGTKFAKLCCFLGWRFEVEEKDFVTRGEVVGITVVVYDTNGQGVVCWELVPIPTLTVLYDNMENYTQDNSSNTETVKISEQLTYPPNTEFREVRCHLSLGEGQLLIVGVDLEI